MEVFVPEYYDRFRCIAAACPDSCCKEWEVDVDEQSAAAYRQMPGELGERLRQVLREYEGGTCMTIENGRCPMWREDGLCRIQAERGHDALCKICREYPRLRQDYGDFAELGLEMSCPEAARLIFLHDGGQIRTEQGGGEPEYDPEAMEILLRSRQTMLDFWETTDYAVQDALTVTLLYAHQVQAELDGGERGAFDPAVCLIEAKKYAAQGDLTAVRDFFLGLEILTPRWERALKGLSDIAWSAQTRALMRYFLRRYWLQAVWDYDLVCRVKFAVTGCVLINAVGSEFVETAQLFSKEIENDADNVDAILDAAYTAPALTDANLLGLLLKSEKM